MLSMCDIFTVYCYNQNMNALKKYVFFFIVDVKLPAEHSAVRFMFLFVGRGDV